MNDQPSSDPVPPKPEPGKVEPKAASDKPAASPAADGTPAPANTLTPEEQMALYEKELKENDWGHQPC